MLHPPAARWTTEIQLLALFHKTALSVCNMDRFQQFVRQQNTQRPSLILTLASTQFANQFFNTPSIQTSKCHTHARLLAKTRQVKPSLVLSQQIETAKYSGVYSHHTACKSRHKKINAIIRRAAMTSPWAGSADRMQMLMLQQGKMQHLTSRPMIPNQLSCSQA